MFDVIVIGGGVIGGLVLRELTKYDLRAALLEKENDVCMGASKANSGIVHAGFDAAPDTLKAKFNVLGNKMMPQVCRELGVKYKNNGSLVVAFSEEDVKTINALKVRGEKNGVEGLEIVDKTRLREMEKNVSDEAVAALYAKTGGIVCPYELTIAAIGNAMDNGAELFTDFEVTGITKQSDIFTVSSAEGKSVEGRVVINCAGLASGRIASLVGDDYIKIKDRKGEYILLDRESGDFVNHTLFFTPTRLGKGILVTQTADNNILLGPTAEEGNSNTATSADGLSFVIEKARKMCKNLPLFNTITSFAGVRAYSDKHDFIIEESKNMKGLIHCAGIESPGLTASPAIAEYVAETLVGGMLPMKKNGGFNGNRKPDYFFKNLSMEEKNEVIKRDSSYGKIVCRCEQITEGEILRAIRENPPAKDIDGVKRRTRAGMGRCQGGFCQPYVAELIAKEQNKPLYEITKSGEGSYLLTGVTK
ncbi:MAG: NAD(P)/FAD-dependent oxidoreductase [Candidatus Borkfalkiaceae bacterium]|nr:NAD(P)/FAD-dependent oxidoreductase [Clostridia bacterium]MDY6222613.1 NAD(P)/FAD-dependent oxidoreductase [Christensenellaceae bacterium]